jgi:DNA mismatch repair protein MutL
MSQIRVLPDQIANQIAAGEVVERPAAVVKELIENSMDAGATRIEVVFRKGGIGYIKVSDNGSGMSKEQALLSLERHATSKLQAIDDLKEILSYGFRGEAIPSIASVSRYLMRTRTQDSNAGTEILILGGKIQHVRECGVPPGTITEVDRLFYNVPARRKFLKTEETESGHILHLLRLYAMAAPHITFTLKEDQRTLFSSPACPSLKDRVGELLGREIALRTRSIYRQEEAMTLEGLAGPPSLLRNTRQEILFFVNGRPVDTRLLTLATIEAYRDFIPRGRFPVIIANLSIPPEQVDVNVHPTKREVRFRNETATRALIIHAIREFLEEQQKESFASVLIPTPIPNTSHNNADHTEHAHVVSKLAPPSQTRQSQAIPPAADSSPFSPTTHQETVPTEALPTTAIPSTPVLSQPKLNHWLYLGTQQRRFLLFSHDNGLTLVNATAARNRISFEKIQQELSCGPLPSQSLTFPLPIELNAMESRTLREQGHFLHQIGFEVEEFGGSSYRITAIPAVISPRETENLLREVLVYLQNNPQKNDLKHGVNEWIARHFAFHANISDTPDSSEEAYSLVEALLHCLHPLVCPAGNPTMIEINNSELQKRFFPKNRNSVSYLE